MNLTQSCKRNRSTANSGMKPDRDFTGYVRVMSERPSIIVQPNDLELSPADHPTSLRNCRKRNGFRKEGILAQTLLDEVRFQLLA